MKTNKEIVLLTILFAVFAFAQSLSATIIYQDVFSGPAASLNGRVPDTASNGTNWSSPVTPQFAVDGSGNGILSAAVPNVAANNGAGPTLPFTPDGSSTYALSVDVNGFGDVNGNHWLTLGFTGTNGGLTWFTAANGGRAEILMAPSGLVQTFGGSNGTANGFSFNAEMVNGTYTLILNSANGDVIYRTPNKVVRIYTLTPAEVASIRSVQLSAGQATPLGLIYNNFILQTTNINLPVVAPVLVTGTATVNLPVATNVYSGSQVSLISKATGAGTLSYDWVTDNGSGGASWTSLGSNSTTLVVDTTPLNGSYQYALVCSNSFGAVTSAAPATLNVTVSSPALTSDISPANRTSYTGKAAKFTATFAGSVPLIYRWLYSPNSDGSGAVAVTNLAISTNNSILLTNLTLPEAGYYSVQASNSQGTLNSSWASLKVLDSSIQTNGLWIDSFSRSGALNGSTADVTNSASAWNAIAQWTTTGSEGQATGISSGNSAKLSAFPITLVPGKVYQVSFEVLTLTGTAGNWAGLGFFSSSLSSAFSYSTAVAFLLTEVRGEGQTFYGSPGLPNGLTLADTGGIGQYAVRLTVLASGSAVVEFFRNGVVIRTGSLTSAQVAAITGVALTAQNGITVTFDNFRVENLSFPATPTAGTPVVDPGSTVYAGTPVTLNISAGGQQPLFYQWQTDNGSGGASFSNTGGNSTNLLVDTTSLSGAYQYLVVVTNLYGSVTSAPITLPVNPASAPFVTKDTRPSCIQDVPVGQTAYFLARFDGTQPIAYQWQFSTDGGATMTNIPGQTNILLTLTNVQTTNAGYYSLRASNAVSPFVASSSWSQLMVHSGVNQLTNPVNLTYIYNDSFSRSGFLDFVPPDVVNIPNELWYGQNPAFLMDGDQVNITGGNSVAHIALVPTTNTTYILSGLLIPVCGNGASSCTLGFNTATGATFPGNTGWIAYGTAFGDGTGQTYAGASAATGSGTANSVGGPGAYTMQLAVAGDGSGTVLYAKNSEIYATNTLTSAQVGSIQSIAVLGVTSGGAIDDVKLAYIAPAAPTLSLTFSGANLQLTWQGTLLESTNLLGPWTTNSGVSPLTIVPTAPQKFFRARNP